MLVHWMGINDTACCGDVAAGSFAASREGVTCPDCREYAGPIAPYQDCTVRPAESLRLRVGNVEVIGTAGEMPLTRFKVLVNGKEVRCRKVEISGAADEAWRVFLDFFPQEGE